MGYHNNISKCAQMDPQQLPETPKFYFRCKKCDIEKTVGGWYHPLGSLKVKGLTVVWQEWRNQSKNKCNNCRSTVCCCCWNNKVLFDLTLAVQVNFEFKNDIVSFSFKRTFPCQHNSIVHVWLNEKKKKVFILAYVLLKTSRFSRRSEAPVNSYIEQTLYKCHC